MQLLYQTNFYRGKVRDVYTIKDQWLVMVASNRISAFDVILPREIPFKGQVLNQTAALFLNETKDIVPNWLIETPLPNVAVGYKCTPIQVEMVIRGNLTGHAWRTYQSGKRVLCGASMPDGLKQYDYFPQPIITPSTKAHEGHDEDITPQELISRGIMSEIEYRQLEDITRKLFERGKKMAAERGLILADTKYEFGKIGDTIYLMDEIHTPDSSRYFYADGFEERQLKGEHQKQLSKEFVREWLIENHFMGKEGEQVPEMNDKWVQEISHRYIELYEKITGKDFDPIAYNEFATEKMLNDYIEKLIHHAH